MRRFLRATPAAVLFLAACLPPTALEAAARKAAYPTKPDRSSGARRSAAPRIRRIRVIRRDIFDTHIPAENKKIYRLINALHFSTKESAIRDQLLMKEGDLYNADLAKESERALRGILLLRNVKVTPLPINRNAVDLLVITHETWTTEPVLGFTGVGSNLNLKAGIRERNLLGYGKNAGYFYKKTNGVISRTFSYDDPSFLDTPLVMSGDYEDREDGTTRALSLRKPFRSTITPWSLGGDYKEDKREVKSLDSLGKEVARLKSETRDASVDTGISVKSTTRLVRRPGLGYRRLDQKATLLSGVAPESRDRYDIFNTGYGWERVNFLTVNHIKQYDRDEDYPLGPSLGWSFGASRRKWVPDSRNANFFKGNFRQGSTFGPSHFALLTVDGDGKFQTREWRAAVIKTDLEYYNHFQARQTLACHLGWAAIVNPGPADQLLLGGDTGLRAYKINQFAGNKKLLANVEDRFFVIDDVLRFMSVGAVVFSDAGTVWAAGHDMSLKAVKADVGVGMRLYLNRTSVGHVLRFDLAYAAKRVGDQSRLVFTFGSSHAF